MGYFHFPWKHGAGQFRVVGNGNELHVRLYGTHVVYCRLPVFLREEELGYVLELPAPKSNDAGAIR
jgi:hypothetical protein